MQWKLFADLGDVVGTRHVSVDVGPDATVADGLEALLSTHPDLRERVTDDEGDLEEHVNVVRNGRTLADGDLEEAVDESDEYALFPPVSGG